MKALAALGAGNSYPPSAYRHRASRRLYRPVLGAHRGGETATVAIADSPEIAREIEEGRHECRLEYWVRTSTEGTLESVKFPCWSNTAAPDEWWDER